jgi:hypothetical protein
MNVEHVADQIKSMAQANGWRLTPELIARLAAFIHYQNRSK